MREEIQVKFLKYNGFLITKHNKLYYRIEGDIIYMITLFDTRQNPKKNRYE
jgi:hypothetical protein